MLLTSGGVNAMNGMGMYATWLAGPVLQITLLFFMIRRELHGVFPRFFPTLFSRL